MGLNRTACADRKPLNVILFLVDDLGWTDLGCYGSRYYETPNIDRLASQGMRFTDAYAACTVCSPTRASIISGKYPGRVHITDWIPGHNRPFAPLRVPEFNYQLPLEEITIAEALKPAGYTSASMGKWHLGGDPFYPDKQGFDLNVGGDHRGQPPSYFSPHRIPILKDGPEGEYMPDRLAREANKFIADNRENSFFLYLPFYEVHTPLQAKQELIEYYEKKEKQGSQKNPKYAAMIHSTDEAVGKILAQLDELGLADNTLILFTGDNGGLMPVTGNEPLRAGKGSAYEGGVREPLIVRWPGVVKPGSVCSEPVISVDFYPTIVEAAGAQADPKQTLDGKSLVPLLKNPESTLDRDSIFWHYPHYHPGGAKPYGAIRRRDFKLIEFFEDGKLELYNLKDDIGETNDLAETMPEKTKELHDCLKSWRQEVQAQMPYPNPDYDPERKDQRPGRFIR
ncbi:MAG: sulfatase [Candidatus Omnitrophica bacterium]|nr:sulfatase [Candidatus Omnitrophota bacterium]